MEDVPEDVAIEELRIHYLGGHAKKPHLLVRQDVPCLLYASLIPSYISDSTGGWHVLSLRGLRRFWYRKLKAGP